MANKKEEAAKPELKEEPSKALMAIPKDLVDDAGKGGEEVSASDVRPPRLALAQSGSPQVKRTDKYIEGLREGDLYNNLTGEIYGIGPVEVVVIKYLGTRGIIFAPQSEGGGILESGLSSEDPRMQFTLDPNTKKRIKPRATKFMDFLVYLPKQQEVMVLSMKGTSINKAVDLLSLLKSNLKIEEQVVRNPPFWARTFDLGTASQTRDIFTWSNFTIRNKGLTPDEIRLKGRAIFNEFAKKNVVVDDADDSPDEPAAAEVHPDDPGAEKEM